MTERQRLVIEKLVLENFKSYAGRHTIGPFTKTFTAIVGPNGSGKSNIIDSLLFVFGWRARKLRQPKLKDLIHKSDDFPDCISASVSVHFHEIIDHTDGSSTHVKDSEFSISRTINQSSSYYSISSKKVPFSEVSAQLKRYGIDLANNRFLILQGEVEQISLLKPKARNPGETGLLEFLESVIGSDRLVPDIEKAAETLEETAEARSHARNRHRAAVKDRDALADDRAEALNGLRLICERLSAEGRLCAARGKIAASVASEGLEKAEKLQQELTGICQTIKDAGNTASDAEDALSIARRDLTAAADQVSASEREMTQYKLAAAAADEDIRGLKGQQARVASSRVRVEKQLSDLDSFVSTAEVAEEEAKQELDSTQRNLEQVKERFMTLSKSLEEETTSLRDELAAREARAAPLSHEASRLRGAVAAVKAATEDGSARQQRLDSQLRSTRDLLSGLGSNRDQLEVRREQAEATLSQARDEHSGAKDNHSLLMTRLQTVEKDLRAAQGQKSTIESGLRESRDTSALLAALLSANRSGELTGIRGRLGDLGSIDERYQLACVCAFGRSLDYIVVDTMEQIQQALAFLRAKGLGVTTFLSLDHVTRRSRGRMVSPQEFQVPAGTVRVLDLVRPQSDTLRPAFWQVMRDTLVSPTLQAAQPVAQGRSDGTRHRVVTLRGEVFEPSGTLSGGGDRRAQLSRCKGIRTGSAPLPQGYTVDQLREAQERIQELEAQHTALTSQTRALGAEVDNAYRSVQRALRALELIDVELSSLRSQEPELRQNIRDLERRLSSFEAHSADSSSGSLDDLTRQMQDAEKRFNGAEKLCAEIRAQIDECGGAEVREARNVVDTVTERVKKCERALKRVRVQRKGAGPKRERLAQKLEELGNDEAELEDSHSKASEALEDARRQYSDVESNLSGLREIQATCSRVEKQATRSAASANQALQQHQKAEDTLRSRLSKVEAQLSTVRQEIAKREQGYATALERLSQLHGMLGEEDSLQLPALPGTIDGVEESLDEESIADLARDISEMKRSEGELNSAVLEEWRVREAKVQERLAEYSDVNGTFESARDRLGTLRDQRSREFLDGFQIISTRLREMYRTLTLGGDAQLELVDTFDPFEGVVFSVMPPRKSWKQISNLSGGEKTLSSLALIFALHHFRPAPLYVMDEIDAALDFRNVSIVANYVRDQTLHSGAQFVVISLRNNTFELADRLVGVYKTHNCSKVVRIDPARVVEPKTGTGDPIDE
eukprot:gnl/Dysnectes_brevis/2963_a3644_710.p1 GENE.gnl/Dysnectes_brevis/2963_a3644_710~~gnl/Dysnectes_brevis/2963_a3644_710.p1  ORF type:complete len:1242 (-),score=281.18 gnl/Dysnectes_brevis/2963_a3644_710:34-3759(-)